MPASVSPFARSAEGIQGSGAYPNERSFVFGDEVSPERFQYISDLVTMDRSNKKVAKAFRPPLEIRHKSLETRNTTHSQKSTEVLDTLMSGAIHRAN